jgi:hypothetical protein
MDDLNGRKDTPKKQLTPIGMNHISPNEQRWIAPAAEDLREALARMNDATSTLHFR